MIRVIMLWFKFLNQWCNGSLILTRTAQLNFTNTLDGVTLNNAMIMLAIQGRGLKFNLDYVIKINYKRSLELPNLPLIS